MERDTEEALAGARVALKAHIRQTRGLLVYLAELERLLDQETQRIAIGGIAPNGNIHQIIAR